MLKLKSLESSAQEYSYDVFLSFSGEDTRKTFTDHLYTALIHEGLTTFRDDEEIQSGESIKSELENGIRQSRSWIIVFSKNYAFSSWCLDELVLILECRSNSKGLLLPIFYHVDPSDVRKQSGFISEAIAHHEEKFKREVDETKRKNLMDKIKHWRIALTQVANLGGMPVHSVANGYESKLIQKIVNAVKEKMTRKTFSMIPHPVGIGHAVQQMSLWLRNGSPDVEVFALYGIGGVGKTTIAKYVYDMNFELFEGGSFIENIREYSERSDGLVCLQRQLLSDISKGETPSIKNRDDGILKIISALHHKELLIVLDDVDQVEQLDAIYGLREWFHQGSKIIITTRNVHLLNAYEHCTRYAIKKLNSDNSLELFSWHAFQDIHPPECYIEHSARILKKCQGLPLALKVLGASLRGKKVDVWGSRVKKLEIIPHSKIQKILRISYDSLEDDHDRDLFLEIACFFIGETKSFVARILDECNCYTLIGIQNLIDRCLLKIDKNGNLKMHQSIQDMGREIIRQQSPKDPGQRSRLWHWEDSLRVLKDETGTEAIEGLALDMNTSKANEAELRTKAFSIMHKLRLLKLNNVRLSGDYKHFPEKLKWLCWHKCPLRSLPSDFPVRSLVAIDMQSSKLEFFYQGNLCLDSLKFLNLSHCHGLVKSPDFAKLCALEQLLLEDCGSLVEIDESIGKAGGLVLINLKGCKILKKLPESFCMLKLLKKLNISGCSNLGTLPAEMRKMESLKVLRADGLNFGYSNYTSHQNESWREFFWRLVSKPRIRPQLLLTSLTGNSITSLSLENCNLYDNSFPKDFRVAHSLKYLNLSNNPIRFLPDFLKALKEVEHLRIVKCSQLQTLEDLPLIKDLEVLDCPLLEKITLQPGWYLDRVVYPHKCEKLFEMETVFKVVPIGELDSELIDNFGIRDDVESMKTTQIRLFNCFSYTESRCGGIQVVYTYRGHSNDIFSIFFPGRGVPKCFPSHSYGHTLTFTLSHSKLRYLNTCIVYRLEPIRPDFGFCLRFFNYMTYNTIIKYCPACYGIPEGDEYMTWLCHLKFGSHEAGLGEPGDIVYVSVLNLFCEKYYTGVKEIGVYLVYEEQEQEGVHTAKRQKVQQTCDEKTQYVIPVEVQSRAHHGTTQSCFMDHVESSRDSWLERDFGKDMLVETGEPSTSDSELD